MGKEARVGGGAEGGGGTKVEAEATPVGGIEDQLGPEDEELGSSRPGYRGQETLSFRSTKTTLPVPQTVSLRVQLIANQNTLKGTRLNLRRALHQDESPTTKLTKMGEVRFTAGPELVRSLTAVSQGGCEIVKIVR